MKEENLLGAFMPVKEISFNRIFLYSGLAMILLISTLSTSGAVVKEFDSDWTQDIVVEGGRTVLVEELSATWCTSCAEIDPYLQQVADSHGSRISIVTYHPTDGEDAFQPPASELRIERLKITHPDIGSTPSFIVEGGVARIGPESWPDVQKDILLKETEKQSYTKLAFSISNNDQDYSASITKFDPTSTDSNTQITFLLVKHESKIPDGFINPGENYRDRVVVGYASCNLENNSISNNAGFDSATTTNCAEDFGVTFSEQGKFSLILIHEALDSALADESASLGTLGVVEFAYRDTIDQSQTNILPAVIISFSALGIIWAIYERKGR